MKMLIKSNKGSNCIPSLRNSINDENFKDIVYGNEDKCDLLNKYCSLISKLEEENVPLPDFDMKTNNVINEVFVTISEIVDILKIIDPNKASGPDKISHKMLKIFLKRLPSHYKLFLANLFVNANIPLGGKMHMSHPFLKRVILLYLQITAQYH
jgi:hypothetical protein